jgi:hypothetical protein
MLPNHLRRLEHVHLEPRLALIQHHVHVVLRASRRSRGVGRQLRTAPFLWGGGVSGASAWRTTIASWSRAARLCAASTFDATPKQQLMKPHSPVTGIPLRLYSRCVHFPSQVRVNG